MGESFPDWNRPHYLRPGGKPFLFYVVYGEFGELPILDSSKYRSAGVPFGFQLSRADSERYPDDLTRFQEGATCGTRSRYAISVPRGLSPESA